MDGNDNDTEKTNTNGKLPAAKPTSKEDRMDDTKKQHQPPTTSSRKRKAADIEEFEASEPSSKHKVTRSAYAPSNRADDVTGSLTVQSAHASQSGVEGDEKKKVSLANQPGNESPGQGRPTKKAPKLRASTPTQKTNSLEPSETIEATSTRVPLVEKRADAGVAEGSKTNAKKAKRESNTQTPKEKPNTPQDVTPVHEPHNPDSIIVLEDTEQTHDNESLPEGEDKENLSTPSGFSATTPRYMASIRSSPEEAAKFARSDQRLADLREEQHRLQVLFMQIQDGKPVMQAVAGHMKMLDELAKKQQEINAQQQAAARAPLGDCSPLAQYIELTHADMRGPGEPNPATLDEVASYRPVEQIRAGQQALRASGERGQWLPENFDSRAEWDAIFRRSLAESYGGGDARSGGN